MSHAAPSRRMTVAKFLAWEECEPIPHELIHSHVHVLPASDDLHALVTGNVYVALRRHLHGTGFRTLTSAVPVVIDDCVLRPDVFVVCDDADTDPCVKRAPVIVIEVLSPATAAFDRGEKVAAYRLL